MRIKEQQISGSLNVVVFVAAAAVAYADWVVVAPISLGYLYILPICFSALVNPFPFTVALAVVCTFLHDTFGPPVAPLSLRLAHDGIDFAGFFIAGLMVTLIARKRNELALEVRRQRDEYEQDLALAAQVQRRILSVPPEIPGFEMAASMRPARLLGGDYYDFFRPSEGVIDVVIADVSGKGAAAALLMPSLAVALRLTAGTLADPAEIIQDLDRVLKQVTDSRTFVTVFYGRLHCASRTLQYANAGHNPPMILRTGTGERLMLEEAGPILGILERAEYHSETVSLKSGDILVLFTDGIVEQENRQGEEFSTDRLAEVIRAHAANPAQTLVADVTQAVRSYAGTDEQVDDRTIVIVKVE